MSKTLVHNKLQKCKNFIFMKYIIIQSYYKKPVEPTRHQDLSYRYFNLFFFCSYSTQNPSLKKKNLLLFKKKVSFLFHFFFLTRHNVFVEFHLTFALLALKSMKFNPYTLSYM